MSKITLGQLADLNNSTTATFNINTNSTTIQTAFDDTLSRAGFQPNVMNSPLDMNNNRIINLPPPGSKTEPIRLADFQALIPPAVATSTIQTRIFDSRSAAVLVSVPIGSGISFIETGGYTTAGDGGHARYFRTGGSTVGGFQTADGSWWALADSDVNILQFGAITGQGNAAVTTTAFTNAVTLQTSRGGGNIFVPAGSWWLNSTITFPTVTASINLIGASYEGCAINANANITLIKVLAAASTIKNIAFIGRNNVDAGAPTIWLATGASGGGSQSIIDHCQIFYGLDGIFVDTGDVIIQDCFITQQFLAGVLIENNTAQAQAWLRRCRIDQGWPATTGSPAYGSLGSSVPVWTTGAKVLGQVVSLVQGGKTYYLQCTVAGTSAGSQPTVVSYNVDIVDGSAIWRLASTGGYTGLWCDTNAFEVHCEMCDFNGSYVHAVQLTNTAAGAIPASIFFTDCVFGGEPLNTNINASVGYGLVVKSCEMSGTILNPSNGIVFGSGWSGPAIIEGNVFYGTSAYATKSTNAIQIAGGTNTLIKNNYIGPNDVGVLVGNSITRFGINGNTFQGTGSSVTVGSGCDRFTIQDNMTDGGVTNGSGTSASKILANNV